jgi:hypothetical protein
MVKRASRLLDLTKRGATAQYRALVNELELLLDLFPHLRDSYDADELPVSFILKRDAGRSKSRAARRPGPTRPDVRRQK